MKFDLYTIDLSAAESALCSKTRHLWDDAPSVSKGPNKLKKPEWTRVLMALQQYTFSPHPDRKAAARLADRIYDATENRRCEITRGTEPDPVVEVKPVEKQGSLF